MFDSSPSHKKKQDNNNPINAMYMTQLIKTEAEKAKEKRDAFIISNYLHLRANSPHASDNRIFITIAAGASITAVTVRNVLLRNNIIQPKATRK